MMSLSGGEFHDQGDAKWIVIRGQLWVITISPSGGQTGLAALRAYLVVSVTID
jgi:hypothetical protein